MELARPISVAVACDPSLAGLFSILELKSSEGLNSSPDQSSEGLNYLARPRENSSYRSRFRHGVQSLDDRFRFTLYFGPLFFYSSLFSNHRRARVSL